MVTGRTYDSETVAYGTSSDARSELNDATAGESGAEGGVGVEVDAVVQARLCDQLLGRQRRQLLHLCHVGAAVDPAQVVVVSGACFDALEQAEQSGSLQSLVDPTQPVRVLRVVQIVAVQGRMGKKACVVHQPTRQKGRPPRLSCCCSTATTAVTRVSA